MKKTLLVMLVAAVVLPVASARAGDLCSAVGAKISPAFCSLAPSAAILSGEGTAPSFAIGGTGWMLPVVRANPLNFGATFPGKFSQGVAAEPVQVSAQVGRQTNGEGGGAISAGGLGVSMNGAPDGWFNGAIGDSGRFYWRPWNPNITADTVTSGNPLDPTPEPLTLALFGTGLLLIALIARRRSVGAGGEI